MRPGRVPTRPRVPRPGRIGAIGRCVRYQKRYRILLLQQTEEFIAIDARVSEDAAERAALDVFGVNRDRDDVAAIGMGEVVMAALGASKPPALLL